MKRSMVTVGLPLELPDEEREKDTQQRKDYGTPESYTGFEKEESRSELTEKGMNSSSPQQPPETAGDVKRDFARTVRSFRTPTDDMDKPEYPYC